MSTTDEWRFHTLDTAADLEARPPALPPEVAQDWCNFILFMPERVPGDCTLGNASVRKEAPRTRR